ncbi:hypothetical protein IFO70_37780 [Phormidium tenue FACHB-886]|nr:hypothetical protein [Phormidium tenue FACHB-886]
MKNLAHVLLGAAIIAIASIPTVATAQEVPTTLRQEMPYAEARQILLDAGWQAVFQSPNRQRFAAMGYLIDELGYNEVVSCSGTGIGFCAFEFMDAYGNKLAVSTVDNQPGQQPLLYRWWLAE